ncbi:MAG: recombinase RecT [Gammaproteobacteria bacterium]|nr:recombinase RecT [Gammaproteobacteria bacterium]
MNQSTALALIDGFKQQIRSTKTQDGLREFMPDALLAKFTAVTIHVVQRKPELLQADRTSLFLACQDAAKDGLMPDNREGALIVYGDQVQWQPMIHGMRKKMAQAGYDLRAEIVYKNDIFRYDKGDDPKIIHEPDMLSEPGEIVLAYAIATHLETGLKWREAMRVDELEKVRLSSRSKNSPAWTLWKTEMYRKTVAKRLRKSIPMADDSLLDLIDRDNQQYDMETAPATSPAAQRVQEAVRAANEPVKESEPIEGELERVSKAAEKDIKQVAEVEDTKQGPAPNRRQARSPAQIAAEQEQSENPEPVAAKKTDVFDF